MATQINEMVDRYYQGVVFCEKEEEVSKLKAEPNHKFMELSVQIARAFELEKEEEAAAEELVKLRAQFLDMVS